MNVLIIGYGGMGQALAKQFSQDNHDVHVISRSCTSDQSTSIDLSNQDTQNALEQVLKEKHYSLIINTIGVLYDGKHQPEKNIGQLDYAWLQQSIDINVLPTMQLVQALSRASTKSKPCKLIVFSARVSSISDNRLGGWYSYRMTKCMLNMFVRNVSIEWKRSFPKWLIASYHPGTVNTQLSKPFQTNVPDNKLFSPEQAAKYCITVIDKLSSQDSGYLFDWKGDLIEP